VSKQPDYQAYLAVHGVPAPQIAAATAELDRADAWCREALPLAAAALGAANDDEWDKLSDLTTQLEQKIAGALGIPAKCAAADVIISLLAELALERGASF